MSERCCSMCQKPLPKVRVVMDSGWETDRRTNVFALHMSGSKASGSPLPVSITALLCKGCGTVVWDWLHGVGIASEPTKPAVFPPPPFVVAS